MIHVTASITLPHGRGLLRACRKGPHSVFRPLRGRLALAAVIVPLLVFASPGQAQSSPSAPNFTPITQSRWTYASASVAPYSDFRYAEASGFKPFVSDLTAGTGGAFGWAYQTSQVLPDAIVAKGAAFSSGFTFNDPLASGMGSSWVEVRFSVATTMSYRARGILSAFGDPALGGNGASLLELKDGNGVPLLAREASGVDHQVIDERGLLAPGEYVLLASAGAVGHGQIWFGTQASFDLAFEVQPVGRTRDLSARIGATGPRPCSR